jgi:hypothetical protein
VPLSVYEELEAELDAEMLDAAVDEVIAESTEGDVAAVETDAPAE